MKMNIDSIKLKKLRNQKCWSQDHLAQVTGLSLRTVQRIEAKGVASHDSIKSLASVYGISCEALLASTNSKQNLTNNPNKHSDTPLEADLTATNVITLRKKYLITTLIIIAANVFGLWGVYSAYSATKIDHQTFSLLKGIVSINLIVTVCWNLYRGFKKGVFSLSELD